MVQLITFRIEKDRLKAFASFFPLCFPVDYILNYGIEITGSNGFKLLNGKYFTTIYEPEFDKVIQLKNYHSKHQINMQKLFLSIKEGVLPEMDRIDSLDKFIKLFDQSVPVFFGYEFDNTYRSIHMDFPFYDAPNTATIVCCHVMNKEAPILYVSHDEDDGMWQFLCGKPHDEDEARIVSLKFAFEIDNSVGELKDIPCGYYATRESKESYWTIKKI